MSNKLDIALIGAGNSGVGKSFLLNVILKENRFDHREDPDSVTEDVTYVMSDLAIEDMLQSVAILNIPGLIEIDEGKFERNKNAMTKAFEESDRQVVMFVFGNTNGRPNPMDVQAFLAFKKAYELNPGSILFVFNSIPASFTEENKARFVALVAQAIDWEGNMNFVFVERFRSDDPTDPACAESRAKIIEAIENALPERHEKKEEIVFDVEQIQLLEGKLTDLNKKMKQGQVEHEKAIKSYEAQVQHWKDEAARRGKKKWYERVLNAISGTVRIVF